MFTLELSAPQYTGRAPLDIGGCRDCTLAGDSLVVTLHSRDPKRYFLASRGFHWIDDAPEDR
jgi:hypothetical protein